MIKKRTTVLSILLVVVLSFSAFVTGCNKNDGYTLAVEDVSILLGHEFTPDVVLKLNGDFVDSTVTLTSSDSECVSVDGGKLKGEKTGEATITAVAKVENKKKAKTTFKCEVKENKGIHPIDSSFLLYVSDNVKGVEFQTSADLNALVYEDGAIIQDAEIEWTVDNQEIASIDEDNRLHAVSLGETHVVGSYDLGDGQSLKTIELPVKVEVPILATSEDLIIDKQKEIQTFDAQTIIGKSQIGCVKNLDGNAEYSITDNQIKTSLFKAGEHTCVFYDKDMTVGVEISVVAADFVVYNNDDLLHVASLTDGYIALANDLSNVEYRNPFRKSFKGVFNGLGHSITDIKYKDSTGLFYNTNGATIKNVAIINASLEQATSGVFMYRNEGGETIIDNTYVTVKLTSGKWDAGGAVAFVFGGKVVYSNSIIYSENFISGGNGLVLGRAYAQVVLSNCFAIGEGTICGTGSDQYNKNFEAVNRTAGVHYSSNEELLNAYSKNKVNYSNFNKYWDVSTGIPTM